MTDFQRGWYRVSGPDANGRTYYKHFETPQKVSHECYIDAEGNQVLTWRADSQAQWKDEPLPPGSESVAKAPAGDWWDNAKSTSPAPSDCPFCQKRGLPIMVARPGVARADAGVQMPQLGAAFTGDVRDIPLPTGQHYTLRVLRGGHLYVCDLARGTWDWYLVSDDGYLYLHQRELSNDALAAMDTTRPQQIDRQLQPPPTAPEFSCRRNADHMSKGRCIVVQGPDQADRLWLAFTDVAWTKRKWKEHAQAARSGRKPEYVREISLASVRSGGGQSHVVPLVQLSQHLAEATVGDSASAAPLAFSLAPPRALSEQVESLLAWAQKAAEPSGMSPLLVSVPDPVGVVSDLAVLMGTRLRGQVSDARQARPLAISAAIANIRQSIREDAENREIFRTEREALQMLGPGAGASGMGGTGAAGGQAIAEMLFPRLREQREAAFERWRTPTAAQLATARDEAWGSYESKYSRDRLDSWSNSWQQRMQQFDTDQFAPLARAHVQWMESARLCNQLDGHCDDADAESGAGFVDTLLLCIQDTQEYAPCAALYRRWLAATAIDRRNLVLRALGYNQKALLEHWQGQVGSGLRADALRGLPWDGLITGYDEALEALANGSKNAAVRLTLALGGPLGQVAAKAVDGVVGPALVAMGVIARAPVVMVEVTMRKQDAIAELVARATAVNPKVAQMRRQTLNNAIDLQLRKARIFGARVEGTRSYRWLMVLDQRVVEDFPGGNARGAATQFARAAVLTDADRARLTQLRWRQLLPTAAGLGAVTGILQCMALGKLADDVAQSMEHEHNENQWRYHTGIAALAGTLAETVGRWSESAAQAGSRYALRLEQTVGRWLRAGGKVLGIGTGLIMAVWDGIRGWREIQEGNAVGLLYLASTGATVIALFAFSKFGALIFGAAATGVGILLVVLVLVIAVLIEVFKDNKVQDWLERCYFGSFETGRRYQDPELELRELELALNDLRG